jgi:succinoglycan biosynthesis protein ExoA
MTVESGDLDASTPVSFVMPVRNEERHLAETVSHVLGQDYPGEIELIIAVGPSRDHTAEIARKLAAANPAITVVPNPSGRIPCAINAAIKASRHPIVARVDGHALLPPGYLRTAVRTLAETGAVNVGGVMAAEGVTPFGRAVAWAMTSPAGIGAARFHTGGSPGPAETAYLGVFRRSAIEQVGGYDEAYLRAEDWEMNHRIRKSGGLIWFQPDLRVIYRPRATVAELAAQFYNYGRWRRVVSRQHPGTINLRYLAPPLAVGAMAAGTLAGLAGLGGLASGTGGTWPAVATAGLAVPVLYAGGVVTVAVAAAGRLGPTVASRLPLVLGTMHISWGIGFLTSPRSLVPGYGQAPGGKAGGGRYRGGRYRGGTPRGGRPVVAPTEVSRAAAPRPRRDRPDR